MMTTSIDSIRIQEDLESLTYKLQWGTMVVLDHSGIVLVMSFSLFPFSWYSVLVEPLRITCTVVELCVKLVDSVELFNVELIDMTLGD